MIWPNVWASAIYFLTKLSLFRLSASLQISLVGSKWPENSFLQNQIMKIYFTIDLLLFI